MKAEEKSISEIFADNNSYEIPNYQRPYSWNQDNVSDLVNDINDAFENGVKEYFIGSIILNFLTYAPNAHFFVKKFLQHLNAKYYFDQ